MHSVKELEVKTLLTLASQKDYLQGDNSDIVATDSQKNTVYVLAKKHGVKSPEEFAILLSKHFLSTYSHVTKAAVTVEEVMWNRVSYGEHADKQKLHNHAFIHTPICTRFSTATLKRGGEMLEILWNASESNFITENAPTIISGISGMKVLKTTQSSFVNFVDDSYRTLPDMKDRIFR